MKGLWVCILMAVAGVGYGQNWQSVSIDTVWGDRFRPTDVLMLNDSLGYLVGYSHNSAVGEYSVRRSILKTINAGATWDSVRYISQSPLLQGNVQIGTFFQFNYFRNKLHALVGHRYITGSPANPSHILSYGVVEDFQTAGEWDTLIGQWSIAHNHYLTSICAINDSIVVCGMEGYGNTGNSGIINGYSYINRFNKHSKRFDETHIPLPDTLEFIKEIFFVDEARGYVAGGSGRRRLNGYLFYTNNGGLSWQTMKQASTGMYHCVKFFDRANGILGGDEDVYFTRNGGFDWYPAIGIPSRFIAQDIALVDGDVAYIAGVFGYYQGSKLVYDMQIYKSLDRGKEWCLVYEEGIDAAYDYTKKNFHISAANKDVVVATFPYNRVVYTANGGGITECVTGISEAGAALLKVYPNPNNGSFTVALPLRVGSLTITDLAGKVVFEAIVNSQSITVNDLAQGMYLLKVQDGQHAYTQKVVVAK